MTDRENIVSMRDQAQMLLDDIGTDREWVAIGLEDCDGFAEVIAMAHPRNAHLIAAAPDLLSACKVTLIELHNLADTIKPKSDGRICRAVEAIKAALQKAGAK